MLAAITLNIWVVLFTCGFVMGIFMTLLFVFFHKRFSPQTHNIAVVLFILSLMLLGEIAEESDIVDTYPVTIGLGNIMDLLIWPFLLFYTQYITASGTGRKWLRLITFVPYLAGLLWQIPVLTLSGADQLAYYSAGISDNLLLLIIFKILVTAAFLFSIIRLLNRRIDDWKAFFPKNKKVQFLTRVKTFFQGIGLMVMVIYLLFFNSYFDLLSLGGSDRLGSLIISGFFYFLAALVFRNPQLFKGEEYSKQVRSFFEGEEQQYAQDLLTLINTEKPYLNEKLSLKDLAEKSGLSSQQLSYIINRQMGISFQELVNTYRIREVQKHIASGEHIHKTLLGLALESGFNSKASFNRAFKEHTGHTPSHYVKTLGKEVSNQN
ncbi:MAG: helix-turn-helix transcriptional regulator [Roseivirga sp.]|nr:helix-turn-helix transcriptional regulator [Roseivirga sp.]